MAAIRLLNVHRTWEDWAGIVLGVLVGLSPWLASQQDHQVVMWNAVLVGALVLALAALELGGCSAGRRPARLRAGCG